MATANRRVLPGFVASLSFTWIYLAVLVLIPLGACFFKAASLSWEEFHAAVWSGRARAAYRLTIGTSLAAALLDLIFGFIVAWVLVRYEFPLKRLLDSLVDLPLALPTAVAGLVYSSLYAPNGWFGQYLTPMGIRLVYTPLAIVWVLTFLGIPFIVRTVQPVLEEFDVELEEAAQSLGASRWQTFVRVILPSLVPALITGFALAFARCLGEYGSVIFVAGNIQYETEIAPVLIVDRLEAFNYAQAAAIAVVLLMLSFTMLVVINILEQWSKRYYGN